MKAKEPWQGTVWKCYRAGERGQLGEGVEYQTEGLKFYLFYTRDPFKFSNRNVTQGNSAQVRISPAVARSVEIHAYSWKKSFHKGQPVGGLV